MNGKDKTKKNQVVTANIFEQQELLKKVEVIRNNLKASTWHELTSLNLNLTAEETIYTVKITDEDKNDTVEEKLQQLTASYPDYTIESRVQELADELQIQRGVRMFIYLFTGMLTCIGLAIFNMNLAETIKDDTLML